MRFSIIVPVYNTEKYLQECIESVLAQHITEWELIIVDDGSKDNSGMIADAYAREDPRIRVIHKENGGQLFARLDGVNAAAGEYILFLDSDDLWREDCLEQLSAVIDEDAPDAVMFTETRFRDHGSEIPVRARTPEKRQWLEKRHIYQSLLSGADYNSLCFKAWHRTLFAGDTTDYTSFAGTCWGEDKALVLHLMTQAQRIFFLPEALYRYRYHDESVLHRAALQDVPMMLSGNMFRLVWQYMQRWKMDDPDSRERATVYYLRNYLSVYYRLRRAYQENGSLKEFRAYDWAEAVDKTAFRYANSPLLTSKEKLKLLIARYFRFL